MKVAILFYFMLAIASSTPTNKESADGDRYVYIPDDMGEVHLVDLQQQPDPNVRVVESNIKFYLFTRPRREEIFLNLQSITNSNFHAGKNVKIIAHGWNGDLNAPVNSLVTTANLNRADVNVIVVDWGAYAKTANYLDAARRAPEVGVVVSKLIDLLIQRGAPAGNIHLVGFSLGAHLVGNAGRHATRGRVWRITGLDPAGPTFGPGNANTLRPADSSYTEIIHTNGDYVGNGDLMGHVDFFPNGGRLQPGCNVNPACSHSRSYEYYAETIGNTDFMGRKCNNINDAIYERCSGAQYHMGGSWDRKSGSGIYHVYTNSRSPFAIR